MGNACCTSREEDEQLLTPRGTKQLTPRGTRLPPVPPHSSRDGGSAGASWQHSFSMFNKGRPEDIYNIDVDFLSYTDPDTYVKRCVAKDGGAVVVMKVIARQVNNPMDHDRPEVRAFMNEVRTMQTLHHPHIVRLCELFADDEHFQMVTEISEGGELLQVIKQAEHFNETQAAHAIEQIAKGVNYVHKSQICHRNLRLESCLCTSTALIEVNTIKLTDFGDACRVQDGSWLEAKIGSCFYIAPEVLKGKYNALCDVWSMGVIMYMLLGGRPPFDGQTDSEILRKVSRMRYNMKYSYFDNVSQDAKDLVSEVLVPLKDRRTAEDVLRHRWVLLKAPKCPRAFAKSKAVVDGLMQFYQANKFKKLALKAVASQLDAGHCGSDEFRAIFEAMDEDSDGRLSFEEMRAGMKKAGMQHLPSELEELLNTMASSGGGEIDYDDFISSLICQHDASCQDDVLKSAFRKFDRDGDGKISKSELQLALRGDADAGCASADLRSQADSIFGSIDKDGDGEIDFDEFKELICSNGVRAAN